MQARPSRQPLLVRAEAPAGAAAAPTSGTTPLITKNTKRIADNVTELIGGVRPGLQRGGAVWPAAAQLVCILSSVVVTSGGTVEVVSRAPGATLVAVRRHTARLPEHRDQGMRGASGGQAGELRAMQQRQGQVPGRHLFCGARDVSCARDWGVLRA